MTHRRQNWLSAVWARASGWLSLNNPRVSLSDADEWDFGGRTSASGVRVDRRSILTHSAVFRGVNLISTSVAKIALNVWDREAREIDREHPAYPLLRRKANPQMTAFNFRRTVTAHSITHGNGYGWIRRDGKGTPIELRVLLPDRTSPFKENGVLKYMTVRGGDWDDFAAGNKKAEIIDASDVLHIPGLTWDGLTGYSLIDLAADELGLAIAAVRYGAKWFENAASPSIVIEFPNQLSDKAFARIKENWQRLRSGIEESHKPQILEEGGHIAPFAIDPAKAQLLESRKFDLVTVANWLGIPVHKVGGEGRTSYGSLEQENQAFLDECLDAWLCAWESECSAKLLTEAEQASESRTIEFLRQQLVIANITQRFGAYRTALAGGSFMTINEIRALENRPPIEGGDEIKVPLNMGSPGGNPDMPETEPQTEPEPAQPADDPPADPPPADRSWLDAATRKVIADAVRRMATRIDVQATKAKRSAEFLDTFAAKNDAVLREAFGPAESLLQLDGPDLREWFCAAVRNVILAGGRFEDLPEMAVAVFSPENAPETEPNYSGASV